ncbi:PREDICTED: uncharacterized protein LOC104803118 [Tarenaya hassleriana]|uniref:uncharacterized protein LOC104803118 n=1 Tax=Tarenaya hassleriana TaxID=28532 RepID=UPI00053C6651|nr:PREDICTED: uncharacterized protein LOC104803118 [Tarenaya hassleriana]
MKSSKREGNLCIPCFNEIRWSSDSPMEMKHPYHPPHSLSLLHPHSDYDYETSEVCSCCGDNLGRGCAYHCPLCSFFMHLRCAEKPPVLEVAQPKSHGHKLVLLPKPRPFTCDACGLLLDGPTLPWACLECGVMFHRECIDLPRVIRISRHPQHRLCYVPSPPSPAHEPSWSCGVCRKVVDNPYGAYSCIKGCDYVAHSKCATRGDVWDGADLEGVPEEAEDVEDPFEVIDDKVIHHFSHEHHLKLNEDDDTSFDGSKHCQACALPIRIHLGNTYRCMQFDCEFILHQTCANLSRKIWYMLHPHRLELQASSETGIKRCDICPRLCSGFIYKCCKDDCPFKVHVNYASVAEPFIHISHPHPLFSTSISMSGKTCSGCRQNLYNHKLECIECDFVLCLRCLTLPPKVRYGQDRHPLVLRGGEDVSGGSWWCEICERKMDTEVIFYACDSCCVTVHVDCMLGRDPLIKPGQYSDPWLKEFEVAANNRCFRPLCARCRDRCPFPIFFKRNDHHFCSSHCLDKIRT